MSKLRLGFVCFATGTVLVTGAGFGPAAASATGAVPAHATARWRTLELPPPPGGLLQAVVPQTVSCAAPGYCAAGGYEQTAPPPDTGYGYQDFAIVALDVGGRWHTFSRLQLPANAMPGNPTAQVTSTACPTKKFCVAVGYYTALVLGNAVDIGFVATESAGKWTAAAAIPNPAGFSADYVSQLDSVSCPTIGYCQAIGSFGPYTPLTVSYQAGAWHAATEPPVPAKMASFLLQNTAISCHSPGDCVAVGTSFSEGTDYGLQWIESRGHWGRLSLTKVPLDAQPGFGANLTAISCSAAASCVAVGFYVRRGYDAAMQVTLASGRWRRALSDDLDRTQTTLYGVSCTFWQCVAVGRYFALYRSVAVSERHNALLGSPVTILLPRNAIPNGHTGAQTTALTAVSCLGRSWCVAVGYYTSKSRIHIAMATIP